MTIPIKFRGRDLSGKLRYGFYAESAGFPYIIENHTWHEVQRNSVAQLVGYDVDGKEVYEGDTVLRYDGEEEFAEAPENGVLCEVVLYTQVNPDLESYYCFLKENHYECTCSQR